MLDVTPPCRYIALLFATGLQHCLASFANAGAVRIKSTPFDSILKRLSWAGSSAFECDAKCKQACLASGLEAAAPSGDSLSQRTDICVAGCGCGGGSDHMFATLENGNTFISTDAGQAWKDIKTQVPSYIQKEPHRILHVHTSHTDPRSVVLLTNTTTSWISHDSGSSWKPLRLTTQAYGERRITAWRWHPTNKDSALAESKGASKESAKNTKAKLSSHLAFYTTDGGVSFKLLAENVEQCHWAVNAAGGSRRVVMTRYVQEEAKHSPLEIYALDDMTSSKKTILLGKGALSGGPDAAAKVFYHFNFIFALVNDPVGSSMKLWFYSDAGKNVNQTRPFREAQWPKSATPQHKRQLKNMQVLYSAQDTAMFYVPVKNLRFSWGHVFSCNYQTNDLSPVLTDVRRSPDLGIVEWQALNGIDGAFIANRVVLSKGRSPDKAEKRFGEQEEDAEENFGAKDMEEDSNLDGNDGEIVPASLGESDIGAYYMTRTYISFDMGTIWQPLKAPEKNVNGELLPGCETSSDSCLLHFSRWETSFAAPGLILASGNTGVRLSDDPDHSSIFLSRDSGITWKQVLEGPHEFSMLGHGDMLAAVPRKSPGSLLYSTDNGRQWTTITVVASKDKGAAILGVFAHPSRTDFRAFLQISSDTRPGMVMASVDLSEALQQECKLIASAGSPDSDFEKWSPADGLEDAQNSRRPVCVLGVRTYYVRRKVDRTCRTGLTKLPPLDLRKDTPCECTAADFACDIGYHRTSYTKDATCELLEGSSPPNVTQLCDATLATDVSVTRGYTKILGNRCSRGVDLSPLREPCPGNTGLQGYLRGVFYSHRTPIYMSMVLMILFSFFAIQRQRAKSSFTPIKGGLRKKYDDARFEEDDPEREFLIDPTKI